MPTTSSHDTSGHDTSGGYDVDEMTAKTKASMMTPSTWSLTQYTETPSRNGVAWSGVICKDGVEVGRVSDAGRGGMIDFEWTSTAHMYAFWAEEEARYGTCPEPGSDFVNDLATAAQHNADPGVVFTTEDADLLMGECFRFKPSVTPAQAKDLLLDPACPYATRQPLIWDKTRSVFVPAADFDPTATTA